MRNRAYRTLGDVSLGRKNNFDVLRFCLATLVIYSHSFALLFNGTLAAYDPLLRWTHGQAAFGGIAVDSFFLISGFLITQSRQQSKSAADYAGKRIRRILPALIGILIVTVFIFGPLATELPLRSYFLSHSTWAYFGFLGTVSLHESDRLPGVFAHNPLPWRVNGSLWTIRCETIGYILVGMMGSRRVFRHPVSVLMMSAAALGMQCMMGHGEFSDSLRVLVFFLWGLAFALYRDFIPYTRSLLLSSLAVLLLSELTGALSYTLPVLGGYALFYFAFCSRLGLQNFAKYGDFSYGLYLYAFPVQQMLVSQFPGRWNIMTLTLASLIIAGGCAILSWHLVEKRWLRRGKVLKVHYENPILQSDPTLERAGRL
ncbi:MAG: acyltransferase family protein [Janthinobacterium lividum]